MMRISHIGWNLAGLLLPLLAALFMVPQLIDKIGPERFGLLALAWSLIGYAGVLDLGIGRALTQFVSKLRGTGDFISIPYVLRTASRITFLTGTIGGCLIILAVFFGVGSLVKTQSVPQDEIRRAMLLMAFVLPAQAMSATYKGMNEAYLNFKGISLLRIGLGVINFAGPFIVVFWTKDLFWLVATLVGSRLLALIFYRRLSNLCIQGIEGKKSAAHSPQIAKTLFQFGGWVALSSVLSPIMLQVDRFVIASIISTAAVTTYVVPYEVVVQSLVLVGAVTTVFFPTLSKLIHEEPDQWKVFFRHWLWIVSGSMLFVCVLLAGFLPIFLRIWLKNNFLPESVIIGQVLCIGVFFNAVGSMYYSLFHAKGRADLTLKFHLIELPPYILALIFLLYHYGLIGAAYAWAGRMFLDAVLLSQRSRVFYA
jgi:O-antigen/teichoic acid export membrane protein